MFNIVIKYKYFLSILFIMWIGNNAFFSQQTVKIGLIDEIIYPFESNHSNLYFDFFKSKANFSKIDIVGMGEATHGTKEFFNLKKETFKNLVLNFNYKIFGIEASLGGCSYINDYVNLGIGNIDSVMENFDFSIWRTEEVKELVLWIKEFNVGKPQKEKIIFYGFDMQNFYSPLQYINSFFNQKKLITVRKSKRLLSQLFKVQN